MNDFSLTPYRSEHLPYLRDIFASNVGNWFAQDEIVDLERFLEKHLESEKGSYYWVLLHKGDVIGSGGLYVAGELAELSWGMIKNDLHGIGAGKYLLTERIKWLKSECPEVKSIVSQTSPSASGFFAKKGFIERHRESAYWGKQIDLVGMELSFDGRTRYIHPNEGWNQVCQK